MSQLYRDLVAWKKSMSLVREIYVATNAFPRSEMFGLRAQVRRAAVSVPSNIAEGYARFADGDLLRFLRIARGSLAEVETQLTLARDLGFLLPATLTTLLTSSDEVGRILTGLISSVSRRIEKSGVSK